MEYCVLLLPSVHDVMKAEKILIAEGVALNVVATPRELSYNCGVVIRFECKNINRVLELLDRLTVEKKIFRKIDDIIYSEVTQA